ncbi:MAG: NAD(P)-dependent methylenetetrahydromethanopterin dehydrogenase [Gammaproteobacteria bacterium]
MNDPYLLHIFNPTKNVSPFDVNMAYETAYDGVIPYTNVTLEEIHGLTQDTIFSRGPAGMKRTAIFIGGREFGLAMDMLDHARNAMIPPFAVSVFADPSGAITTAAALVACIESCMKSRNGETLAGKKVHIMGGTGPVGICAGVLAYGCGAEVYLASSRGCDVARNVAEEYNARCGVAMRGASSHSGDEILEFLEQTQVVIGAAKAGIKLLDREQLEKAGELMIAADVNAVPPPGIEGVDVNDMGTPMDFTPKKAVAIGALAIGNVKYKVHYRLFEMMQSAKEPVYLDHIKAFDVARKFMSKRVYE